MSDTTKKIIAGGVVAVALVSLAYGTYLPFRKSRLYITALSSSGQATSLDEFLVPFMAALDASGPIGDEELLRNFAGTIGNVVEGAKAGANETLVRAMGATLDRYAQPVLERRSGLSQAQTYYLLITAYRSIDEHDGTRNFRDRYYALLKRGLELSPDRPQFLYGLIDYERRYGSEDEALRHARRVKELWPGDKNIDSVIRGFERR